MCANNPHSQKYCKTILSRASKSIMSRVFKEVNKDIHRLKKQCKNLKVQLVNNLSDKDYKTTYATIRNKVRYMEKAIRRRHSRKLSRDKITEHYNIDNKKRKNRRFCKKQLINKKKLKPVRHKNNYRERIQFAKVNGPDENAINLSSLNLTSPQKSLLSKGPFFVPTAKYVNWYELRKNFTKFVNQLRFKLKQYQLNQDHQNQQELSNLIQSKSLPNEASLPPPPPRRDKRYGPLYNSKPTNNRSLELFIDNIEKDLFNPTPLVSARPNISKREQNALKEIKSWKDQTIRIQDKGSRFVILENRDYEQKIIYQIERNSFKQLPQDPRKQFEMKVNNWIEKWHSKNILDNKWKFFITPFSSTAGKMYGKVKTHKENNPVRVITSGCNTAVENLTIFVENVLFELASKLPSRERGTCHMLEIIDDMNNSILSSSAILLSFDVVNMFPSIDNNMGIASVRKYLDERESKDLPTDCVIEALELCLSCNNSVFNNTNYLQTDGTAQGLHMPCSYADIAMAYHNKKALSYFLSPTTWKRFRDNVFVAWEHGIDTLPSFLDYLNNVDGKIKFTMEVADQEKGLEFLDLRIKCVDGKLSVDVFAKPTNSFTNVKPSTCYPRKSINNVPRGIALRLRRICDTDEKFESRANEYKQYLLARDYKPSLVDKQFQEVFKITRAEARAKIPKNNQVRNIKFLTTYNPSLPKIDGIIRKHLPLLHSDDSLKKLFPANIFRTIFKRNKNLSTNISTI